MNQEKNIEGDLIGTQVNGSVSNLIRIERVKGQLHPLTHMEAKLHRTRFALATDSGRDYYVLVFNQWNEILSRLLWERVIIKGEVDYCKKTIKIHSLLPDEIDCFDQYFDYYDDYDFEESSRFFELLRRKNIFLPAI